MSKLTTAILTNLDKLDPLRAALAERGRVEDRLIKARSARQSAADEVTTLVAELDKIDLRLADLAINIEKALGDIAKL